MLLSFTCPFHIGSFHKGPTMKPGKDIFPDDETIYLMLQSEIFYVWKSIVHRTLYF